MEKYICNPFLPLNEYIADGEPHIFGGRVYLYGSHDKEGGETFCMLDYVVWSAPVNDLTDWRCEGTIYKASQDPDYPNRKYMYAPDCVQGNDGRYYLYYCMSGNWGRGGYHGPVSVAVCDTPAGKFEYLGFVRWKDGTPMQKYVCFDPAVINDNGTIRLYYGTQYDFEEREDFAENPKYLKDEMEMFNKSAEEILNTPESVMGPNMLVLEDDMLTVKSGPVRIIPYRVKGTDFEAHPFFEAPSMRKVMGKYYFIYSSKQNHELCYAVSDHPDRDFRYGGVIVSNGDVGCDGRAEEDRLNMTGTNHGSIIEIEDEWYVFYHRMTHKSDYSRQACAEKIRIEPDGSIKQKFITTSGMNKKMIPTDKPIPAAIACHITNGHMPHGSNKIFRAERFPHVTHEGNDRFIAEISNGTRIAYRHLQIPHDCKITLTYRAIGDGRMLIFDHILQVGSVGLKTASQWTKAECLLKNSSFNYLVLRYEGGGEAELLELAFSKSD